MSKDNLPPLLAAAYLNLTQDEQAEHRASFLRELDAVSELIGKARSAGIDIYDLVPKAGITVGADKFCPCCLRPFSKVEP
jgi:hypothetical protein